MSGVIHSLILPNPLTRDCLWTSHPQSGQIKQGVSNRDKNLKENLKARMSDKAQEIAYVTVDRPWGNAWGTWAKRTLNSEATKSTSLPKSPIQRWASEDQRDQPWSAIRAVEPSNHTTQDRSQQPAIISYDSDKATQGSHCGRDEETETLRMRPSDRKRVPDDQLAELQCNTHP